MIYDACAVAGTAPAGVESMRSIGSVIVTWLGLGCTALVWAGGLAGRYIAEEDPAMTLALEELANGDVSGTLTEEGVTIALRGRTGAGGIVGTAGTAGDSVPFRASMADGRLLFELGDAEESERLMFRAAGSAAADVPARRVVINGQRLGAEELARAEQVYGIRIADAEYWYDPVLGAWGPRNGPTMGFIAAGLPLGGPLAADASGGGTAVFVNGREIHPYDLTALQRITGPIAPGRYFITAQGLAGPEGGPPLWNLVALAATQGGGSNSWQSRVLGASGFSDGTTGAVFLPNGGIVSTGE
jgi:hypothetical protein